MDTIKDFFQSIFDSYRDRIKSPLIGSFIITFLIYNWRSLAVLFYADWPIHCKIEWIDERYCNFNNFFFVPICISLFYVLMLPYINIAFEIFLIRYSNYYKNKVRKERGMDLDDKVREAKFFREIADAKAGTSEINALTTKNDELLKEIEVLNSRHKKETDRLLAKETLLNEKYEELLNEVDARANLPYSFESEIVPGDLAHIVFTLTDIEKKQFVKFVRGRVQGGIRPKLTDAEKATFINLGLLNYNDEKILFITEKGMKLAFYLERSNM